LDYQNNYGTFKVVARMLKFFVALSSMLNVQTFDIVIDGLTKLFSDL